MLKYTCNYLIKLYHFLNDILYKMLNIQIIHVYIYKYIICLFIFYYYVLAYSDTIGDFTDLFFIFDLLSS